tara:strand:+ start:708 stop:1319 length:612 start_codon:yes stop_codon:yes gene_type:complete
MSKLLLREYYELCPGGICQDLLTEEEKRLTAQGIVFMSGIMQRCDTRNGNGRIYPRPILEREMSNYGKLVKENRALGELDHPEDSVINLKNASHLVTDVWWDGDAVMGKVRVLDTPAGSILSGLIAGNVKLGISSRGLGSVKESNGNTIVEDDFQLICFDFVSEPSTPNAYMVKENKQRELMNTIFTKGDKINRALNEILRKQ